MAAQAMKRANLVKVDGRWYIVHPDSQPQLLTDAEAKEILTRAFEMGELRTGDGKLATEVIL